MCLELIVFLANIGRAAAMVMACVHRTTQGQEFILCVIGETDFASDCTSRGRRRLSPPRGAGWEPVNTFAPGICRAKKSHTSQHCPQAGATGVGCSGILLPTSDKGTV
jgi:hypothetical protein